MTTDKRSAGELLRGARSFGAIIDDPRALRIGFDRPVTDDHRAALLAAINAAIVSPPVAGAEVGVREALERLATDIEEEADNISPVARTHPAGVMISWAKQLRKLASLTPPVAKRGGGGGRLPSREKIAARLKQNGLTSRDGTYLSASTFAVIDAVLALVIPTPETGDGSETIGGGE